MQRSPRVEIFFRTISRHDLISYITNTAGPPLLSRTPDSWPGLVSKHLRAPERPRLPREGVTVSNPHGFDGLATHCAKRKEPPTFWHERSVGGPFRLPPHPHHSLAGVGGLPARGADGILNRCTGLFQESRVRYIVMADSLTPRGKKGRP